jgi:small nuclear ribonucleoprotein (snRNP)-like protein
MRWKDLEGKRIFVLLNSGTKYTGKVKFVDDSHNVCFLELIEEKYGQTVIFPSSHILQLEDKTRRDLVESHNNNDL